LAATVKLQEIVISKAD